MNDLNRKIAKLRGANKNTVPNYLDSLDTAWFLVNEIVSRKVDGHYNLIELGNTERGEFCFSIYVWNYDLAKWYGNLTTTFAETPQESICKAYVEWKEREND